MQFSRTRRNYSGCVFICVDRALQDVKKAKHSHEGDASTLDTSKWSFQKPDKEGQREDEAADDDAEDDEEPQHQPDLD